ncbi:MAG: hypothetical protein WKF82_07545 [Nocardioidaceae bacterium]
MSQVDCCQWQAEAEARDLSFDAGTCAGARISPSGLTIGEPVENVTYADPFGDAEDRNYHVAHWISPQITASFAFHELVASWSATTPPGTWVEVTARVAPAPAEESTGGSDQRAGSCSAAGPRTGRRFAARAFPTSRQSRRMSTVTW